MTNASKKLKAGLGRRDLLALLGTAAAAQSVAAMAARAQSQTSPAAQAQQAAKLTVALERLPQGVLLIGIDRVAAQNRVDVATFSALGQAYYEFEHDDGLRVAVLYGNGPDFSQGLDLASWALRSGWDRFRRPPSLSIRSAQAGPNDQSRSLSPCRGT